MIMSQSLDSQSDQQLFAFASIGRALVPLVFGHFLIRGVLSFFVIDLVAIR